MPTTFEKILVVDDEPSVRELIVSQIRTAGHDCLGVDSPAKVLELARRTPKPVLVVSDVKMPGLSGPDLLTRLKEIDETIQVVMVSGSDDLDTVRDCLRRGAYDYLIKPFEYEVLANTINRAIDKNRLLRQNRAYRLNLETMIEEQTQEILRTRDIALMTLAKLAESRDTETGLHIERMARYSRRLAAELANSEYAPLVTPGFVDQVYKSSPLHDIGKVGIPDSVLLKAGPLTDEEFELMKTHATIGGDTLQGVIESHDGHTFLVMAMEIAYSHHEKWDGSGYPAGLAAGRIPLAARIVAIADAYDAITSERPYKKAYDHDEAVRRIEIDRGKHFDPVLVDSFHRCHVDFDRIRTTLIREAGS